MVALIRLKKDFPYPADFKERVRQFNNDLVSDHSQFIADLMRSVPGLKITRFDVDLAPSTEGGSYETLIAERDRMHENSLHYAA